MKLTVFVLSLFLSLDALAMGRTLTMGEAIDTAGRQRMLSQRITQAYILMGIQPQSERHHNVFQRSLEEFAQNLQDLSQFETAKPIRNTLVNVQEEWATFEKIAKQPVSKASATELFKQSNVLLPAAHQYVLALQKLANHSSAELVNISGRQRMLSQRMAKNYVAQHWGLYEVDGLKLLYEDLAEFKHMLNYLQASDYNTAAIAKNIDKTLGHLKYATRGFDGDMSLSGSRLIHVITGTTDIMLRNMDVITKQYAQLMNQLNVASR